MPRPEPTLLACAVAATAACAPAPPLVVEIVTDGDVGPVASLTVTLHGERTRCQRFDVGGTAPYRLAVVDELADELAWITATARDAGQQPMASGGGPADGAAATLLLHAVERPLPRTTDRGVLSDREDRAGQQLAITASGEAAAIWLDDQHGRQVLARRIDAPSTDPPDRPLPVADGGDRTQPVIVGMASGFVAAWVDELHQLVARRLAAPDPYPADSVGEVALATPQPGYRVIDPALVSGGTDGVALWVESHGSDLAGRVGARWIDQGGSRIRDPIWLGVPADGQHAPAGVMVAGDAVVGWLEKGGGPWSSIRLARLHRDAAASEPVRLAIAGGQVRSLAMAPASRGRIAVAWADERTSDDRVHLVLLDAALTVVAGPVTVDDQPGVQVELTAIAGGGLVAAWQRVSGGGTAMVRWFGPDGDDGGPALTAALLPGGGQRHLSIVAADPDGSAVHVAWDQVATPERMAGTAGRRISPGGIPFPPEGCP